MTTQTLSMTAADSPRTALRVGYATLGALLLGALVYESIRHGISYGQIGAFGFAPDLALFYGAGRGLAKGRLHPRAVGLYNLLHRVWGPLILAGLVGLSVIPHTFLIGALAWAFHVALDRAVGYGLRDRAGFQRR